MYSSHLNGAITLRACVCVFCVHIVATCASTGLCGGAAAWAPQIKRNALKMLYTAVSLTVH